MQLDIKRELPAFYGIEGLEGRAQRMRQQRKEEREIKPRREMGRELLLGARGGIVWLI